MRQSRAPRVARGALAASIATFVALLSHVAGGGEIPGPVGLLLPWVLSVVICVVLTGRRLSLVRLSIGVAVSQLLFHALFVLGTGGTSAAMPATGPHAHTAHMPMPPALGGAATMLATPTMWLWHALAAVVTIAALYRGERAIRRLLQVAAELRGWIARAFRAPAAVHLLLPVARPQAPSTPDHPVSSVPRRSALHHRGPPLAHAL